MPNIDLRQNGITVNGPEAVVVGAVGYPLVDVGKVLGILPGGVVGPVGAGAPLIDLSNAVYVDKGTTVALADQTGNIESPFATLAQAAALIAANAPTSAVIAATPGDYSTEPPLALPNILIAIIGLGSQSAGLFGFNLLPEVTSLNQLTVQVASLTGPVSAADLDLLRCDTTSAVTSGTLRAQNCNLAVINTASAVLESTRLQGAINISGGGSKLVDCEIPNPIVVTFTGAPGLLTLDGPTYQQWLSSGSSVVNGTVQVPEALPVLFTDLDANGFAITNYANAASAANLALVANGLQPFVTPFTFVGKNALAPNRVYQAQLDFEVGLATDVDHAVNGSIPWTIQCTISTDGAGVATVTFNTVPVPNISYLPAGLAGASASVVASANGFTVQAQRPPGVACHAWWYAYWIRIKDVT